MNSSTRQRPPSEHQILGGYCVYKFGGTSVGDHVALEKALAIVKNSPSNLVVVVSAMAGITDLLLEAAP
jgi:aspartate kinase